MSVFFCFMHEDVSM